MHCADFDAGRCRSCGWLDRAYELQLQRKQSDAETLLPMARDIWLSPVASPTSAFRNKAKMAIGGHRDAPLLGLVLPGRAGVDLRRCPLYPPSMQATLESAARWLCEARLAPYDLATRRGEGKFVLLTEAPGSGDQMLRLVLRSREALDRIAARTAAWQQERPTVRVVSVNLLPEHRAATEGAEELILSAESSIRCVLNEVEFWLPPGAFLQTNSDIAAELYRRARDWLAPAAGLVVDLYCGVGAFARHLVRADRRLIGVESNTRAIDAARRAPGGVEFLADDATRYVLAHPQADAMVINPPRAGMSAELSTALQRTGPALLLYSSCNPETLARDLLRLPSYRPVRAQLFDMFPHTEHAEILVLMQRN